MASRATDLDREFDRLAEQYGTAEMLSACDRFRKRWRKLHGTGGPGQGENRPAIPRAWIEDAWYRQKGKCARCRRPLELEEATGDHVKAWSTHGRAAHKKTNIQALHGECNSSKGNKTLLEESKASGRTFQEMGVGTDDAVDIDVPVKRRDKGERYGE